MGSKSKTSPEEVRKKKKKSHLDREDEDLKSLKKKHKLEDVIEEEVVEIASPRKKPKQNVPLEEPKKQKAKFSLEPAKFKFPEMVNKAPPVETKKTPGSYYGKVFESDTSDSGQEDAKKAHDKQPTSAKHLAKQPKDAVHRQSSSSDEESEEEPKPPVLKKVPQVESKPVLMTNNKVTKNSTKHVLGKVNSSSDEDDSNGETDEDSDDDDDDDDKEELSGEEEHGDEEKPVQELSDNAVIAACYDGWSKDDVAELLSRLEGVVPKNDTMRAQLRAVKINWDKVAFKNHSSEQCHEKWKWIEKKIRKYRIFKELLADAKDWLEKPWTDFYKSNKSNRHPDMPKRPLTSYMIYYVTKKEKFAKKYPGMSMIELSKVIAESYKHLPEKKKEKYNKEALIKKEEYKEQMQKFIQDHPIEARMLTKCGAIKSQPTVPGPTKPLPPFKLFIQDKLKLHSDDPNCNIQELTQEYKEKWKCLSDKKKVPWIRWAHEAEVKYWDELKAYKAENPSYEIPPFKSVLLKEEKNILERTEGKPEKPPNSAYSLFSRIMLKDPDLCRKYPTPKARMKEIANQWKHVPAVDKKAYKEKVAHMRENYKLNYATYLESLPEDKRDQELASNIPKRKRKSFDGISSKPKLLKQTKLHIAKLEEDNKADDGSLQEILSREPKKPPSELFEFFKHDCALKGISEEKAEKKWNKMDSKMKEKVSAKLQRVHKEFIEEYKNFLATLNPVQLRVYSKYIKSNPIKEKVPQEEEEDEEDTSSENGSSDSSSSDDSDDDSDDEGEEPKKNQKVAKAKEGSNSSSYDSDSC